MRWLHLIAWVLECDVCMTLQYLTFIMQYFFVKRTSNHGIVFSNESVSRFLPYLTSIEFVDADWLLHHLTILMTSYFCVTSRKQGKHSEVNASSVLVKPLVTYYSTTDEICSGCQLSRQQNVVQKYPPRLLDDSCRIKKHLKKTWLNGFISNDSICVPELVVFKKKLAHFCDIS